MGVRFSHPQPENRSLNWLRYFRGIAQLVARLVRDEEAVGSNPAAPTMTDILTASEVLRNIRLFLFADLLDSDTTGAQFTTVPFCIHRHIIPAQALAAVVSTARSAVSSMRYWAK